MTAGRTRCARSVRGTVAVIKTRLSQAPVVGFDETTLRCGPAGQKKYVLWACTETATAYHLGRRDLDSFADFGILPEFAGIAVHDRYANYFHPRWDKLAGHQACAAHLLRDFTDAAQSYPEQPWPPQAKRALTGLIRAWHTARQASLPEISQEARDPLIHQFRHAVRVGLARGAPGARPAALHRPAPRARPAAVLPRP
jgi:hypothetical protein